jgi:hypothetical protein
MAAAQFRSSSLPPFQSSLCPSPCHCSLHQAHRRQARKLGCCLLRWKQQEHTVTIHHVGRMDFHGQDQALRVHQQMTLAALDFL